ncbi:MAG: methylated-DNA--[protein]-cysteine S-methyltransferase [Gloeobacteraceae cyanobacterium ES-bin-316]|nr:methylated-DNA--[protein]-cysteine S-methyltransferase [Ferruginibacter sp.]
MPETIYYNSPLGVLKISGDDGFINQLAFATSEKKEEPKDRIFKFETPVSEVLKKCISQLDLYFSGEHLFFDLSVEQKGTAFQQNVWQELLHIKPGKTISYLQLSKNLGDTKPIRAVGTANGRNNIAIIVPCHRVIGSKGDLVGYSGDLWRKKWLLQHEAKYLNGVQSLFG